MRRNSTPLQMLRRSRITIVRVRSALVMGVVWLKVVLIALALGLDVFAVCIGVGMREATLGVKVRVGTAFATAEVVMNLIGAGIGQLANRYIGATAGYIGFAALVLLGIFMLRESREVSEHRLDLSHGWGLVVGALSISLDSLGIGFSILSIGVPLVLSLTVIACVSVGATTLGLALGRALGERAGASAAAWAGIVLIVTGAGMTALRVLHVD
jgi:putative Mn2+ efflux pump MntP